MGRLVDARIAALGGSGGAGGQGGGGAAPAGDDALSAVVRAHFKTGGITRDQLVAHAFLLLVAGNATVASMVNLGTFELLTRPDQLAALKEEPALLPAAVEEMCRYHTASALALRRVAVKDADVGVTPVKAGEGLIALNMSANRDAAVFEDPETFNIRRPLKPNIAYGSGVHECIARGLSMAELEAAFGGLLTRLPGLRLAVPPAEVQWSEAARDVGLAALPVTW
ncbi:MAG: cytochrome P450 [Monoraphidium minutum]|nr:MAG: cytochrome P450 [Monoraphidium minutum]